MARATTVNSGTALRDVHILSQSPSSDAVVAATTLATIGALLGIALLIFARRMSGALSEDMPRDAMLLTAIATTATLASARIAWRRRFPLDSNSGVGWWDSVVGWSSSAALMLLAIGCCYPAYRTSDWVIWLPLLVADQLWRQTFFDAGNPAAGVTPRPLREEGSPGPKSDSLVGVDTSPVSEEVVQQLYRLREPQRGEVIYGTLRAEFQPGQRTAVIHVGFCPPLPYLPEIQAEAWQGPPTRVKVSQAFAHGTRLEVRLVAVPKTAAQVWIDMAATPRGTQRQGATA